MLLPLDPLTSSPPRSVSYSVIIGRFQGVKKSEVGKNLPLAFLGAGDELGSAPSSGSLAPPSGT
jgi:hypothetical protein